MKAKFLLVPAVVGMFVMTSCNKKATEQTVKAITDFETNWAALGQQAATWSADLKSSVDKTTEVATKAETFVANANSEEAKAKATELANASKNDKTTFEGMWNEYTAFQQEFDNDTKSFTEFKEKVTKGELSDEVATTQLAEYAAKFESNKAKVEGWNTVYTAAKETCMKNVSAFEEAEKMAAEQPKKEEKAAGKKKA